MTTAILECVCDHPYQEKKYGKNRRVHNLKADKNCKKDGTSWRCTVCNKER